MILRQLQIKLTQRTVLSLQKMGRDPRLSSFSTTHLALLVTKISKKKPIAQCPLIAKGKLRLTLQSDSDSDGDIEIKPVQNNAHNNYHSNLD